jgi:hypothetical protein
MRKFATAFTLIAALVAVPVLAATQPPPPPAKPSTQKPATARTSKPASHSTNGTVKSIDATTLVITKPGQKKEEMTFVVTPSTQKEGTVDVGSMVSVRYTTEGKVMTATAIMAKPAKPAAKKK